MSTEDEQIEQATKQVAAFLEDLQADSKETYDQSEEMQLKLFNNFNECMYICLNPFFNSFTVFYTHQIHSLAHFHCALIMLFTHSLQIHFTHYESIHFTPLEYMWEREDRYSYVFDGKYRTNDGCDEISKEISSRLFQRFKVV
jgi:hypothetical protein